ncbi:hypothetical protein KY347_03910 [Candidatus Woesearchaeota archaeon]|nr:hypothetical protein [Candidatus Woesearchaeota archaeon]
MEFRKAIKRIVALGAGASMVGATIFGALAQADLAQYPNQYIKDGKFSGVLVVGDTAAAQDVIGVSDIAVSLQFAATTPAPVDGGTTVTAEGDAWKVATATKILEMSENLGNSGTNVETLRNITTYIGDSELDALASGTASNSKGDATYDQYLYLLGEDVDQTLDTGYIVYAENDQDETADFLYFKSGIQIGRYVLEFTTQLESDVDDSAGTATSTGTYLTDFEDVELNMFGVAYTIVQARRVESEGGSIKLILMGGAVKDTLLESATKTYTVDDTDYEVTLDFVDADEAKFTINGASSRKLKDGDSDKVAGITVGVSEILYQDYAGGVHSATFFLGAQKLELKDTDVTDGVGYSNALKVDDETIDNAYVAVEATNASTSYKLSRIHINMTADDSYYVPVGGKLSENPELDEPQVLFTQNWDMEYKGLETVDTEDVRVKTSGTSQYVIQFVDAAGNKVDLPIAKSASGTSVLFGDDAGKVLVNNENTTISKYNYFIVTDNSQKRGERNTYVLQYRGADKITADNPVLKFKDMGSGDTIEQSYTNTSPLATLKLGGADYKVYAQDTPTNGILEADNFNIRVDLDSSGALTAGANQTVVITTKYGMEINVTNVSNANDADASASTVYATFRVPDNNRDSGAADKTQSLQATVLKLNITAASGKVGFVLDVPADLDIGAGLGVGHSFKTPEDEDNVAYGYDSYGCFYKHETPTNDPALLTITVPKSQREALVYITTKGTTFTSAAATSETGAVTVQRIDVGATKLASEVPNIEAVNSILVGGPCANAKAAEVMGNPADCTEGFTPGVGLVKMYDVGSGNVAMLVAGYAADDTRNAAAVVANYGDYALAGEAMEVKKVNNVLTVAEPSEEAEEPEAEEPEPEPTTE